MYTPKLVPQPEYVFLAVATGMMFAGMFAFFGMMVSALFFYDGDVFDLPRHSACLTESTPPPLVFSPAIFASPPATRDEPPIGENWEIGKSRNRGIAESRDKNKIYEPPESFVFSFMRISFPPPPKTFPGSPISQFPNLGNANFAEVDIFYDSGGFASSVFIRPGQGLTPEQIRGVLESAYKLTGEPGSKVQLEIEL